METDTGPRVWRGTARFVRPLAIQSGRRDWLAGGLGFEPRFSESESDVLPLNYSPIGAAKRLSYKEKRGQRRENTPIFLLQMPQSVLVDLQQLTTRPKTPRNKTATRLSSITRPRRQLVPLHRHSVRPSSYTTSNACCFCAMFAPNGKIGGRKIMGVADARNDLIKKWSGELNAWNLIKSRSRQR